MRNVIVGINRLITISVGTPRLLKEPLFFFLSRILFLFCLDSLFLVIFCHHSIILGPLRRPTLGPLCRRGSLSSISNPLSLWMGRCLLILDSGFSLFWKHRCHKIKTYYCLCPLKASKLLWDCDWRDLLTIFFFFLHNRIVIGYPSTIKF